MAGRLRRMPPDLSLAFRAVIAMTALSAAAALLLTYFPPPRDTGLTETFTTVFKMGMGAVVGVFGGRAAT
jgi:anaerobic C4-dicarboxylate transporter